MFQIVIFGVGALEMKASSMSLIWNTSTMKIDKKHWHKLSGIHLEDVDVINSR